MLDKFYRLHSSVLKSLLKDQTTKKNIIFATDNYIEWGIGYEPIDYITVNLLTDDMIKPRIYKSKSEHTLRTKSMAEVFTPAWVCNEQNNLIDEKWFNSPPPFNESLEKSWKTNYDRIVFPDIKKRTWKDYVNDIRLEITCGEAPYLTSRYDAVSGEYIDTKDRIGLLDRKLRIVSENTKQQEEWLKWAEKALKSIYGYEFQGDSLLIARENILYTVMEYYEDKFNEELDLDTQMKYAKIITWNIWQMDGLKCVIPYSCQNGKIIEYTLFGEEVEEYKCPGCKNSNIYEHNGKYCIIKDWKKNKNTRFIDLINEE